ncbi:Uncharacterized protein Fot_51808 [Forsythia ovata]|uniref:Uncharacterized protein n=1 Tax=Forsythia ovata TaxID=205694 RepID=A0ABD1PWI7_9LAMI
MATSEQSLTRQRRRENRRWMWRPEFRAEMDLKNNGDEAGFGMKWARQFFFTYPNADHAALLTWYAADIHVSMNKTVIVVVIPDVVGGGVEVGTFDSILSLYSTPKSKSA